MTQPMDSIEQAQEREREQNTLTPEQVLETIRPTDLLDPKVYAKLQQMKSQLIPYLRQAMQEHQGYTRLNAGSLLLHLGEAEGTEAFVTALRHPDEPHLPRSVLIELETMKLRAPLKAMDIFSHIQPLPLRRQDVFAAVVPDLQNSNADLRKFAVEVLANLDLPETEETILPLLQDRDREVRLAVVRWFAIHNQDRTALDVAEALLFSQTLGEDSIISGVIRSLEDYIEGSPPVFVQRAVDLLARYVLSTIQQPRLPADDAIARMNQSFVANSLHWALEAIAKANPPQEKEILMSVVDSTAEAWVRGNALERLSQLDRKAALPRLQTALNDRELGQYAAETLAELIRNQPNALTEMDQPAAIQTVLERLNQEQRPDTIARFLDTLIAMNGDMEAIDPAVIDLLDPVQKMQVVWSRRKLTPRQLGDRLIETAIIDPLNDQQWQKIEQLWQQSRSAFNIAIELLATRNRIIAFDAETTIPVDYKKLIEDLLEISQPEFQVSAIAQFAQQDAFDFSEYVQFVYKQQVHRFAPEEMGDWYDVDATLKALNRALQDEGRLERFIALAPDGQFPIIVFAPDAAFRAIADEFAIPLAQPLQDSP